MLHRVKLDFCALLFVACSAASATASGCASTTPHTRAERSAHGFALLDTTAAELRAMASEGTARATLVNVWSSWCFPCMEELDELLALREELHIRGFELLLVSADYQTNRASVESYLRERGVDYPTYIKAEPDEAFLSGMYPGWTGNMPLSLLYDQKGQLVKAWTRQVSGADVREDVMALLGAE